MGVEGGWSTCKVVGCSRGLAACSACWHAAAKLCSIILAAALPRSCARWCSLKAGAGGLDALIELGGGDMRRTLNLLQSTHMSAGELSEESGECTRPAGVPTVCDVRRPEWRQVPAGPPHVLLEPCSSQPRRAPQPPSASTPLGPHAAYATAGKPLPADIDQAMQWLLNEPLSEAFCRLSELQAGKGVVLVDILQQLHP